MTLLPAPGFLLALHCPLNGFAFPLVSPFCPLYNLVWISDFHSDFPLNSASADSSYFEALPLGQPARALLHLKPMLLIVVCTEVSRVAVRECCPDCRVSLGEVPTCASEVASQNVFRGDLFDDRTIFSRTELWRAHADRVQFIDAWQSGKALVMNHHDLVQGVATIIAKPAQGLLAKVHQAWILVALILTLALTERSRTCCKAEEQ